ncbi:MAG: hypothetical protein AAB152_11455 [Candidatus Coatesbacteria bacterium]
MPLSVRQMGMGNVSCGGGDILRAWSNPSLISDQAQRGEVALHGASRFEKRESTFGFGAGWGIPSGWHVAAVLSSYSLTVAETDVAGQRTGSNLDRSLMAAGLAAAGSFGSVDAGIMAKGLSDNVQGDRAGSTAVDLGASTLWRDLSVAVAWRNIGTRLRRTPESEGDVLPTEVRLGAVYHCKPWRFSGGVEYAQTIGLVSHVGIGVEWWPVLPFGLRCGTANFWDAAAQMTAGLSALYRRIGLDYAFVAHPIGPTHVVSLSYAFGPAKSRTGDASMRLTEPGVMGGPSAMELKEAVSQFLDSQTASSGGLFTMKDDATKRMWRLRMKRIDDAVRLYDEVYVVCADFVSEADGALVDLDFWLKVVADGGPAVFRTRVHRVNGAMRLNYKGDGVEVP